jgi:hypothetical protein
MKKEKGDAAFDSVDEVLTDKIIDTSEKHAKNEDTSNLDSTSNCSFDDEIQEEEKNNHHRKALIIAACVGIALLVIGILLCRGKRPWARSCRN